MRQRVEDLLPLCERLGPGDNRDRIGNGADAIIAMPAPCTASGRSGSGGAYLRTIQAVSSSGPPCISSRWRAKSSRARSSGRKISPESSSARCSYSRLFRVPTGHDRAARTSHGWNTEDDLIDAYERPREFCRLAPRTRTEYLKGSADVRARYGAAPFGIINSVALKGNVLDWIEMRWAGKGADKRLDPFKFALSWATGRHPERVPANYLQGIPRFYEGADRAEIIWEDIEVDLFCQQAPELHADAVRLARETGLRIGDLVELERSEIKKAPDGSRAIILRPNKRRRRIVNMPLTSLAEAIIDKAPISRRLILKPKRADAWDSARLSREVREYATEFDIRPELRFNDLRGTKVTEMVWSGISVPDLAIRIGWKIETAAKMLGVYAALNPGRATVMANSRAGEAR